MNRLKLVTCFLFCGLSFYVSKVNGQASAKQSKPSFQRTEFVPTMEHQLTKGKNSIYSSSFLFAWDEVRNILKAPLLIDRSFHDLNLINNSTTYKNSLTKTEYVNKAEINDGVIKITSEFFKLLPFEKELVQNGSILFNNAQVHSFGFYGQRSHPIEVVYYESDEDFIIKIELKDKQHELLLYLPNKNYSSMKEITDDIAVKNDIGISQRKNQKLKWKFELTYYDVATIPMIGFSIDTNYAPIEGNTFQSKNTLFEINSAKQKTGFYLDEKGVEVSSGTEFYMIFSESIEEEGKPKKLIFNKPFFVMLKRVDSRYPYFALWVDNEDLLSH